MFGAWYSPFCMVYGGGGGGVNGAGLVLPHSYKVIYIYIYIENGLASDLNISRKDPLNYGLEAA